MKTPVNTGPIAGSPTSRLGPDRLPNGVCVADGYGLSIIVERRHLIVRDGVGSQRRERRYPRVGHGLDRLVILGHAGSITLDAIRWLDRVGIAVVHLDRDHTLLSGSIRPGLDDARLRRAQALAPDSPVGLAITAQLIGAKLDGQAANLRTHLDAPAIADQVDELAVAARDAQSTNEAVDSEAHAANLYFAAWSNTVSYQWAPKHQDRVPDHWNSFARRHSPLAAGKALRAGDPINATLNYLYALAETECRIACLTLGLDPGLGIVHTDKKGRDSLALDLIEPVRPAVDAYVLELAATHLFRVDDFIEREDGHCRILPPLTHHLAATLTLWRDAVAPWAEAVAFALADASPYTIRKATPLTSTVRRERANQTAESRRRNPARPQTRRPADTSLPAACIECGQLLASQHRSYCADCLAEHRRASRQAGRTAARAGLDTPAGRAQRGAAISIGHTTARATRAARIGIDPEMWERTIAPRISALTLRQIMDSTGYAISHASRIRRGVRIPDPQHWSALQAVLDTRVSLDRGDGTASG